MAKTTHEYDVVRDTDTRMETFQIRSRCAFLCVALSAAAAVACGAGALYPRNSGEAALNALVGDLVRARADADELRAAGRRLIAHGGRENSGPEPPPPKRDARPTTTVRYLAALAAAADTAQKTGLPVGFARQRLVFEPKAAQDPDVEQPQDGIGVHF